MWTWIYVSVWPFFEGENLSNMRSWEYRILVVISLFQWYPLEIHTISTLTPSHTPTTTPKKKKEKERKWGKISPKIGWNISTLNFRWHLRREMLALTFNNMLPIRPEVHLSQIKLWNTVCNALSLTSKFISLGCLDSWFTLAKLLFFNDHAQFIS